MNNGNNYSNSEYTDMLLTLGECLGNSLAAVRRYSEKFPGRRLPNRNTFLAVERRCRETGSFKPKKVNSGRPRTTRTAEKEENILDMVFQEPSVSIRKLSQRANVSFCGTWEILKEQQLHPYHYTKVQELLPNDYQLRTDFCQLLEERQNENPNFLRSILFTDEATFTRTGVFNIHNEHLWAEENPMAKKESHFQHSFKVNVWAATMGNQLIGYHILDGNLNGTKYLDFLRNSLFEIIEDDIPLLARNNYYFMHDGAPPHFTRVCREWLHENFPERWIGRGADAPIHWPPRSPDLNPLDYVVWSYAKQKVYETETNSAEHLRQKIVDAFNNLKDDSEPLKNTLFSLQKRIRFCIRENGGHFEHLF